MTAPRFSSTPVDPRRLTMLPHEIARQPVGERRRIHGNIVPMACPERRRRGDIQPMEDSASETLTRIAAWFAILLAVATIILPGAAWLIGGAR